MLLVKKPKYTPPQVVAGTELLRVVRIIGERRDMVKLEVATACVCQAFVVSPEVFDSKATYQSLYPPPSPLVEVRPSV